MSLLPRKSALAIAAVTDVALNARMGALSGKALAKSLHLPSRHLEPLLQALTREGILKAVRGPHGGYVLAREQRRITAADILRAAGTLDDESEERVPCRAMPAPGFNQRRMGRERKLAAAQAATCQVAAAHCLCSLKG